MGLLQIHDLEIALDRTLDNDEEPNAHYLIDAITAYIETVTDTAFSPHTNETVRELADFYGVVTLSPGPVTLVSSVTAINYISPIWHFDGYNTIYNLYPNQVVDIVYSYGLDQVPPDIKYAAAEMVKSVIQGLPEGGLKSKQVGDVNYAFADAATHKFHGLGADVLDAYTPVGTTYRLGRGYPNSYGYYG